MKEKQNDFLFFNSLINAEDNGFKWHSVDLSIDWMQYALHFWTAI